VLPKENINVTKEEFKERKQKNNTAVIRKKTITKAADFFLKTGKCD